MTDKKIQLENQLKSATTSRQKIDILNKLAYEVQFINESEAIKISEQAYTLSTTEEFAKEPYQIGLAYSLTNLCELNFYLGKTELSFSQGNEALAIFETLNDLDGQANILSVLGFSHLAMGNYPNAMACEHTSIKYARQVGNKRIEGRSIAYLGTIYACLGKDEKRQENYEQALKILTEINDEISIAQAKNNMAMDFLEMGKYEIALQHALQSLGICEKLGFNSFLHSVIDTIAGIYLKMEDFVKAKSYLEQVLTYDIKKENQYRQSVALYKLGYLHNELKTGSAIKHLNQALTLSKKLNTKVEQIPIYKLLSEIYEQQGEFKKALTYHKQFQTVEKEVYNLEANRKIEKLESRHKTEAAKKEAEIYQLKNVELKQKIVEMSDLNSELQHAFDEIKTLKGIVPICSGCKKIRDDSGYWNRIESYIQKHSEAEFSHGMCPDCLDEHYGEEDWYIEMKNEEKK